MKPDLPHVAERKLQLYFINIQLTKWALQKYNLQSLDTSSSFQSGPSSQKNDK